MNGIKQGTNSVNKAIAQRGGGGKQMDTGIFIGDKIITTSWDKIWNKPTTLSGYGITDAYTKHEIDTTVYSKSECDEFFVNKAGDTMTGTLLMSNDSDIYGRSSANSGAAYIIGYRDANISGIVMHDISAANNTKALYIQTNGYDAPSDTGGLAITNDCVTAFGSGDNGSVFRVLNEDDVNLGALFNVAKDGTLTRLGNRIWDAGNDGSGSGLDADLLDGKHLHQGQWDSICYIGGDGVLEIGKYIDFHEEQGMSSDFSCRIKTQGDHHNTITLPAASGTLATLDDNVYSATKLQTPRYIFSKPFDGTGNVTGGAKFLNICIETDNNGNDSGRGSEINNYNDQLHLQYASSNNLICCMGGGNVGIGTTAPSYRLHVSGVVNASGGFAETSDIRKKKVLSPHTVDLDVMAYADLFDYTLIDDEKEIVRVGTNAHYWLDKLPQVVTKDNDEYLSLNYGVLGTVCALSVSKYVKQLEDRVTLLENKIASLQ